MDFEKLIKKRTSVKKFSVKKPDWRTILEALDLARYAPATGGNYNLKFILVTDKKKIAQLAHIAEQDFFKTVHYVVVACSNISWITELFPEKGEFFSKQQAGASIEHFLLALENKGLATCWIGHFRDEEVRRVLSIPATITVEAMFPIGFPFKEGKPKAKIEFNDIIFFDKWDNKKMKTSRTLDV